MTNLTPGFMRMIFWAAFIFLIVIVLTKSFLYSSIAEVLYWLILMGIRRLKRE